MVGAMTGTVASLWRYPVKSMRGERLDAAELGERGLLGDRAYALIDAETGRVISAKRPQKYPGLLDCGARFSEPPAAGAPPPPVRITRPDGEVLDGRDAIEEGLSDLFGRRVTLADSAPAVPRFEMYWPDMEGLGPREFIESHRIDAEAGDTVTDIRLAQAAPPGTFFDLSPVHVLATSTLAHLGRLYPEGRFDVRRYRPNVVIDDGSEGEDFTENGWPGRELRVGEQVRLQVVLPAPRCVMTTLPQGELPRDPGILRTVAQSNRVEIPNIGRWACVGAYAVVVRGGTTAVGDPVALAAPAAA